MPNNIFKPETILGLFLLLTVFVVLWHIAWPLEIFLLLFLLGAKPPRRGGGYHGHSRQRW